MKVFLIVMLAIIGFFGIILISSIKLKLCLSEDGYFVIKYLFLRFKYDIYGENSLKRVKKSERKKSKKTDKNIKKADKKEKEGYFKRVFDEKGIVEGVIQILSIIKLIFSKIAELSSNCVINNLSLNIKIASEYPSETAIYYGTVSAVVYPAIGLLNGILHVEKQEVSVYADYGAKKPEVKFSASLKVRVFYLVKAIFSFIKDYIRGGY